MLSPGFNKLKAIKGLTKDVLKKMKVKDGHAIVILDGINDLEEWLIKVRVPATVGELAEQPGRSNHSSRSSSRHRSRSSSNIIIIISSSSSSAALAV